MDISKNQYRSTGGQSVSYKSCTLIFWTKNRASRVLTAVLLHGELTTKREEGDLSY